MDAARKFMSLLTPKEKRLAMLLLGMMLVMALLDIIGVASILPFITVLSTPEILESNRFLSTLQDMTGLTDTDDFLWFLGLAAFGLLIVSLAFKGATTYLLVHFTLMAEYSVGRRLVEGYLRQPYTWFLNRHSGDLGKSILSEVNNVISNGLRPALSALSQVAVTLLLLVLLVATDPLLALIICGVLGLAYLLVYGLVKGYLSNVGRERLKANEDRFIAVSEAFGTIKEVKAGGLEDFYVDRFARPSEIHARHGASANVIALLPRFLMEAIAFGGILLVVLVMMSREGEFVSVLPIIALYAFAGYRLMPALQQIYNGFSQMRFVGPALDELHEDMMRLKSLPKPDMEGDETALPFVDKIELADAHFAYPEAEGSALHGVSLVVPARSTIGLVGPTGSGKTTLADLILGLFDPQSGRLTVDGIQITAENRRAWQRSIGYVPQQIRLLDESIATNIAFGMSPESIDMDAVVHAAKIANLHDFVVNDLPQKYDTIIGEQGVRLSGGQRQRIGIARALYHKPALLILDEATSALDSLTEQIVMEAVNDLRNDVTVVLITHRLSTVKQCDQILMLDRGEVIARGTYEELVRDNDRFRTMVEA